MADDLRLMLAKLSPTEKDLMLSHYAGYDVQGWPEVLREAKRRAAVEGERKRIAAHFDNMVIVRQRRREFEDRHAEYLGDGVTAHGLLRAVVAEIKGMVSRG